MEELFDYVKPELLIVTVALYFLGNNIKKSKIIKDKYIPLILGVIGIIICATYVFATCECTSDQSIEMAVYTSVTQGMVVAGISTYLNPLMKRSNKIE